MREVGAFWLMNVTGLVLSTLAVGTAGVLTASWPAPWRAVALPVTSAAALGILWLVQFVLMDRVIFHPTAQLGVGSAPQRCCSDAKAG